MTDSYDLVVIGAGPAGEKAATHAAYFGARTAIVERSRRVGGTAVSRGGIPSKTLRETALYITGFRRRELYGVSASLDPTIALDVLRHRATGVVEGMTRLVELNLGRHGIDVVHGLAQIVAGPAVRIAGADGSARTLHAGAILVATGSRPFHPPGIPFDDPDVHDSDDLLAIRQPFGSILVIGGSAVGAEYASIFTALGLRVTLVDVCPRLVPMLDSEISSLLAAAFTDMGMDLRLGRTATTVGRFGDHPQVTLDDGDILAADKVLVAAGRAGNTEGLGLAEAGVQLDERGRIVVDANYHTTAEGVWAAGDVIGPPALASVAVEQGRRAASHALRTAYHTVEPSPAPAGIYSIPEAAMIGLTEDEAKESGIDHVVGRGWFHSNARATIAGSTDGLVKLLVAPQSGRLLGVHIIGEIASELIHQGQAVLHFGGTVEYLAHTSFNVPTWGEAYRYAAFDALDRIERPPPR
ncbi:MAG: Si-specific NAD(P)(+) transhydrogenase [Candidatus Dormibacteria bacterium]